MSDFGITFKNARESLGLTLDQIATETKIGTRFLEAIENEEFHRLPGGIFSRGFVRAYAERLNIDPDKAVADFERQSNYQEPQVMEGLRVSVKQPDKVNRTLYPIAIGALIILIVVFYVVTQQSTSSFSKTGQRVATVRPSPAMTAPQPPGQTPPQTAPAETATSAAPAPPPASSPAVTEPLAIMLEAKEETWIKVLADGNSVNAGEILEPGTVRRYTAQESIALTVGNAGGLDIKVNDRDIRPLGKSGQVRQITITPENLKDLIG